MTHTSTKKPLKIYVMTTYVFKNFFNQVFFWSIYVCIVLLLILQLCQGISVN